MRFLLIDRYIVRLVARPLFVTLALAFVFLLIDRMRRLIDFVIDKGGSVRLVWEMLATTVPGYLSLGTSLGLLLGVLLGFRKLALSSELDVFLSVGVSYARMLRVPYIYTIVLALVNLFVLGYVQPQARYVYDRMSFELRTGALGASINVGDFTKLGKQTLWAERTENDGHGLAGVFVHATGRNGKSLAITARHGSFLATDDRDTLMLRLTDGTMVSQGKTAEQSRVLSFASHDLPIALPEIASFRVRGTDRAEELILPELFGTKRSPTASRKQRLQNRVELHFRLAQIAFMFVLPMFAVALAVPPKRSSSALGIFLAVVGVVLWYKVEQFAGGQAAAGKISPVVGVWLPVLVFAALSWWMFGRLAYSPDGQPIGLLDTCFIKAAGWIARHRKRGGRTVRLVQADRGTS